MASILYVSDRRKKEGGEESLLYQDFLVSRYAGLLLVDQTPTRFSGAKGQRSPSSLPWIEYIYAAYRREKRKKEKEEE